MRVCGKCGSSCEGTCLNCKKEYQREYMRDHRRRRKDIVDSIKDVPCSDCGVRYPSFVMDLDHVRGKKLFHVAQGVVTAYKIQTILDEIAKCEVVCANCHRIRTHNRKLLRSKRK
jgi:hypothetical protein